MIVSKKLVWKSTRELGACEDLVKRRCAATAPNELWLSDITEHPTAEGRLYCCVVLDLYSRKWSVGRSTGAARARWSNDSTRVTQDIYIHVDGDPYQCFYAPSGVALRRPPSRRPTKSGHAGHG